MSTFEEGIVQRRLVTMSKGKPNPPKHKYVWDSPLTHREGRIWTFNSPRQCDLIHNRIWERKIVIVIVIVSIMPQNPSQNWPDDTTRISRNPFNSGWKVYNLICKVSNESVVWILSAWWGCSNWRWSTLSYPHRRKKEVQLKLKSNRGERWLSRQKLFKSLHVKSQLRKRRNEKRDIAIAPFMMDWGCWLLSDGALSFVLLHCRGRRKYMTKHNLTLHTFNPAHPQLQSQSSFSQLYMSHTFLPLVKGDRKYMT